jgi:hypothetical protein
MDSITLQDIFSIQSNWDYFLYVVMFFQFVLFIILFNSDNLRDTLMIAACLIFAFMDKAYLFGYLEGGKDTLEEAVRFHSRLSLVTFVIRIAMFCLPLVLITQTKIKSARIVAGITFLVSILYMGSRWWFEQRPGGFRNLGLEEPDMLIAAISLTWSMTLLSLRRYRVGDL